MSMKVKENLFVGDVQDAKAEGEFFDRVFTLGPYELCCTTDLYLIPDSDTHSYEEFADAVDEIRKAVWEDEELTFVHCSAGISRSIMATSAAYAVEEEMSLLDAYDVCERFSAINAHPAIVSSAKQYVEENS